MCTQRLAVGKILAVLRFGHHVRMRVQLAHLCMPCVCRGPRRPFASPGLRPSFSVPQTFFNIIKLKAWASESASEPEGGGAYYQKGRQPKVAQAWAFVPLGLGPWSCVSLFYVNDISSTGSRGRTWGFPVYTFRLNSDAGYAIVPLT